MSIVREILRSDRLVLREIIVADLPALERIFADPLCMRYYPSVKDAAATRDFFDRLAFGSYEKNGFGLWAMIDRESGELLGDCGITLQDTSRGLEPELGYHLWPDYWGKGYATEAALACRDHAFSTMGLSRLVSIVSLENLPSQKVAGRVHQRREIFSKQNAAGETVERYLYISERASDV
ncbi:RimJ/RimL family protein N-acetyltransferase [Rhizobium sp. BK512]|uniref:GNAT family N-acetyltransferase n=1 Tax=Rhizobium sp. BK512 TaxID=2587010 RepID=UPI00160EDE09|nr:GNAT family N-acetyltransferase [Rhizobium sp. BK512]MBB3563370.1 RimJ/RimL family protein N-acetyltransferase [Rhizobium sp. BK512]